MQTTTIEFHRDHTYACPIAYSLNLLGSGTFRVKQGGMIHEIKVQPGDLLRFNCKLPHSFSKDPGWRVGLFGWQLQRSKGYRPTAEHQALLDQIDQEIAEDGINYWERTRRPLPSSVGAKNFSPVQKIAKIAESTREAILDHLRGYKGEYTKDHSSYTTDRMIKWIAAEPDFRTRTGKTTPAVMDKRLLKLMRRYDPTIEILLIGINR